MAEEQPKKRRGRPKKEVKEAIPAEKKEKAPEVLYNHLRFQRCDKKKDASQYPHHMANNLKCGGIMKSFKTTEGGKLKHYKCEICGNIRVVEGKKL